MISFMGFLVHRTKDDREARNQNLLLNGMSTVHNHGGGNAISHAYIEEAGHDAKTWRQWARAGWGHFEESYKASQFVRDSSYRVVGKGRGYCQRFIPSKKARKLYNKAMKWLSQQLEVDLVRNTRRGLETITNSKIILVQETPVNTKEIRKFIKETKNEHHRHAAKAILAKTSEGIYKHQYVRGRTGRLQAIGYSLQNAPRKLKEVAFKGIGYSYDIEGSQFNILNQIFEGTIPSVRTFCENKKEIRTQVAIELGCSIRESKRMLTASLFGISSHTLTDEGKEIGKSNFIKQLNEELGEAATIMKHETRALGYSRVPDSSSYGAGIEAKVWRTLGWSRKRLAYILQNEEVQCLEALIEEFGDDIILLHHDSITTTSRMDPDKLSRVVFEKTGYKLSFEETIH